MHIVKKEWVYNSKTKWSEKQNSSSPPNSATEYFEKWRLWKNITVTQIIKDNSSLSKFKSKPCYGLWQFLLGFPMPPNLFPCWQFICSFYLFIKNRIKHDLISILYQYSLLAIDLSFLSPPKYCKIPEYFSESKFEIQLGLWMWVGWWGVM